jgi:hypothetical protein
VPDAGQGAVSQPELPVRGAAAVPAAAFAAGLGGLFAFDALRTDTRASSTNISPFLRDMSMAALLLGLLGLDANREFFTHLGRRPAGRPEQVSRAAPNGAYRSHGILDEICSQVRPLLERAYREDLREMMELVELTPEQVAARLGIAPGTVRGSRRISFGTTFTAFSLVAPAHGGEVYENYEWTSTLRKVPGLPRNAYLKLRARRDRGPWAVATPSVVFEDEDEIKFRAAIPIQGPRTQVEFVAEEYSNGPVRYKTMKMSHLTRGLDLMVVSTQPIELHAEIFGALTGETVVAHRASTAVGLHYDGWLLPNDGYVVYGERNVWGTKGG